MERKKRRNEKTALVRKSACSAHWLLSQAAHLTHARVLTAVWDRVVGLIVTAINTAESNLARRKPFLSRSSHIGE